MADLVIWKFSVPLTDAFSISMPTGAKILVVQMQRDEPQMWALVDPEAPLTDRHFRIVGTGHQYPAQQFRSWRYRGTFQMHGGALVWHIFEEPPRFPGGEALCQKEE